MKINSRLWGQIGQKESNVIAMDPFQSKTSLTPIRQVEAYWTALCQGTRLPRRSEIDPKAIFDALKHTFIIERIAPGIARIRVAGQALHRTTGLDLRGMPLTCLFTTAGRTALQSVCERLFDAPATLTLRLGVAGSDTPAAHMVLLPLTDDSGQINRAIGVLVDTGTQNSTAVRYDIADSELRQIEAQGLAKEAVTPAEKAQGFAETQAPFTPKRVHLRLVSSGS